MDSLERLHHSIEQASALISALRRENRDLASLAARAPALEEERQRLKEQLEGASAELERLRMEPASDLQTPQRIQEAELEAARLAEALETVKASFAGEKARLEARLRELELRLLEAETHETMPGEATPLSEERNALARRCAELEVMVSTLR